MKKIINFSELEIISKKFQKIKKKIVLCHGVFDLLHYGHIKHFEQAKTKGDLLVVTVTPNRFVNKGPLRPIFNLQKRMESIAALNCVHTMQVNIEGHKPASMDLCKLHTDTGCVIPLPWV